MLQLFKHEFRNDNRPFNKPGFADVGDPPVYNDAGIQNLMLFQPAALRLVRLPPAPCGPE
ncbi:hypothetical protein D3C86_2021140 [compost metagenome]